MFYRFDSVSEAIVAVNDFTEGRTIESNKFYDACAYLAAHRGELFAPVEFVIRRAPNGAMDPRFARFAACAEKLDWAGHHWRLSPLGQER